MTENNINNIKHIGIYVQDLDKMILFYRDILGLKEIARYKDKGVHINRILQQENGQIEICKLLSPYGEKSGQGDMIELIYVPGNKEYPPSRKLFTPGTVHIALGVKHIQELCKRIHEHGGQIVLEPMQIEGTGNFLAFCRDMEGNYLELIENT